MQNYPAQEEAVYRNVEPGNDFTKTPYSCKSRRGQIMTIIMWNIILFALVVGALALSIYAILDKDQAVGDPCSCMATADTPTDHAPSSNDDITAGQVQELNNTIIQVNELLDQVYISFENRYNALNASIIPAIQSVQNVNAINELDLYMGCQETVFECILDHTEVGTMPSSVSCDTATHPLAMAGITNTDIYCSIDNTVGETNPIVATLDISRDQMKCVCSLVAVSSPTGDAVCKLHVRGCPDTIQLNTSVNVH